jgi:hypothetical protein
VICIALLNFFVIALSNLNHRQGIGNTDLKSDRSLSENPSAYYSSGEADFPPARLAHLTRTHKRLLRCGWVQPIDASTTGAITPQMRSVLVDLLTIEAKEEIKNERGL